MDRTLTVVAACAVLLGGVGAACLFRRPGAPPPLSANRPDDPAVLRGESLPPWNAAAPRSAAPLANDSGRARTPAGGGDVAVRPLPSPVPPMAKDFPGPEPSPAAASGSPPAFGPSPVGPKTHKIVDGDSLPALAKRYLGSEAQANVLFEANRDVLRDPSVLPIGKTLCIPPPPPAGAPPPSTKRPLVPVAPPITGAGA